MLRTQHQGAQKIVAADHLTFQNVEASTSTTTTARTLRHIFISIHLIAEMIPYLFISSCQNVVYNTQKSGRNVVLVITTDIVVWIFIVQFQILMIALFNLCVFSYRF